MRGKHRIAIAIKRALRLCWAWRRRLGHVRADMRSEMRIGLPVSFFDHIFRASRLACGSARDTANPWLASNEAHISLNSRLMAASS